MRISLNGSDWQFKDYYGEDWRWRDAQTPDTRDVRWWREGGRVPGSVLDDLRRLGEVPDPYVGQNSLLCEWVPARTWVYRKRFTPARPDSGAADRCRLVFEGVDYEAEFFLNGEALGAHRGMFTPAAFEVSDRLKYGEENLLVVVIAAAPHEEPQIGRTSRVRTHKARMNYWWDFCPRLVHQGIWDAVYLEFSGPVRIADLFVRPQLTVDLSHADVAVEVELDSTIAAETEVEISLHYEARLVIREVRRVVVTPGQTRVSAVLPVENPALWWPNGQGEQALYECRVRVTPSSPAPASAESGAGEVSAAKFGIRHIELLPNDTGDVTARPYTFAVNGRKIYIKGWNWVPMDALYGVERPARLQRLLTLAQRAHVNLLRVWGGGLIEREAFYDLCDRLGILVWQEFTQSSSGIDNVPSESPEYIDSLVNEAEVIIRRRRNHASLALWCGGNELHGRPAMASTPDVARGPQQPLDDDHPALAALKATVARLDPDRLWLPTSPTGRTFGNSLENIERDPDGLHDVHGPWEYQGLTKHYTLYNAGTSLFHSEFGVEGITNRKSLDAVIPAEKQWPVDLDLNRTWFHLAAWWVRRASWDEVFGVLPDIATYVRATQFIQAEGLRYAVEADRRRKWRNSGTLPWQFNEPYPMAACTSAVDYFSEPKPAYYAVARAYREVTVTAAFPTLAWGGRPIFEADIWGNATQAASPGGGPASAPAAGVAATLHARLVGASGRGYAEQTQPVTLAANTATHLAGLEWTTSKVEDDIFFLDLRLEAATDGSAGGAREGVVLAANRYPFTRTADLAALVAPQPQTRLDVVREEAGDHWRVTVTNAGDTTALLVWLEDSRPRGAAGWAYFDDNYFCLFPGESRTVAVTWVGVPGEERALEIRGWNT